MKQHLKRIAALAADHAPDALMVVGAAAIAYGCSLVYSPAGWIVAGLQATAAGVLMARGRG